MEEYCRNKVPINKLDINDETDNRPRSKNGGIIEPGDVIIASGRCKNTENSYGINDFMRKKIDECDDFIVFKCINYRKILADGYAWHPRDCTIIKKKKRIPLQETKPVFFDPKTLVI